MRATIVALALAATISSAAQQKPTFDWKLRDSREMTLGIAEEKRWTLTTPKEFRVTVTADADVSLLATSDMNSPPCIVSDVTAAAATCKAGAPAIFSVTDKRGPTAVLQSIAGMKSKNPKMAAAASRNRVRVELFAWECIANCPTR